MIMGTGDCIFPDGFLWGSATSAFQTEGGFVDNEWNNSVARGNVKDGSSPADSVHFWKNFNAYISLMKRMHHSLFRMSVEWARIEPSEGTFDERALRHYRDILKALNAAGIQPVVDLHHHSNPMWLYNEGGWMKGAVVPRFCRFARKAVESLGDLNRVWLTINEPVVYAAAAYLLGLFPPRERSIFKVFKCVNNMARAHAAAYEIIHEIYSKKGWGAPKVSFAKHLRLFDPWKPGSALDRAAARLHDQLFNLHFFERIGGNGRFLDMLCVNYYSTDAVKFPFTLLNHPGMRKSRLGWDIHPEGFYEVLRRYWELFRIPIYVTENGVCDDHDELRPSFILDHVYQMHRAVSAGVRVEGYLHWTTMDNFEYAEGYSARFGLVHVDHASRLKRMTIKKSGRLFGEIAKANGITDAIVKKYLPGWRPS